MSHSNMNKNQQAQPTKQNSTKQQPTKQKEQEIEWWEQYDNEDLYEDPNEDLMIIYGEVGLNSLDYSHRNINPLHTDFTMKQPCEYCGGGGDPNRYQRSKHVPEECICGTVFESLSCVPHSQSTDKESMHSRF